MTLRPSPLRCADSIQLHIWIDRVRNGDLAARDELLRDIGEQLQALTHNMLGRFPRLRR